MKHPFKQVTTLILVLLLTLPFLMSCGSGKAASEENEIVTEMDGVTVTKEDGIPVYDQYKGRVVDLGLTEKETLYDIIEIDGQLRATVGVLDPDYDPNNPDIFNGKPYFTEHRWYSLDYVENTAKREKTTMYYELTFPADPVEEWAFGGEYMEDYKWGDGVSYGLYRDGVIWDGVIWDDTLREITPDLSISETMHSEGYGIYISHLMVRDDIPYVGYETAPFDSITGAVWRDGTDVSFFLYINGHHVDTQKWVPGDPHYTFRGLIGIRGEPYALLEIDGKGRLVPLTPESTEMTFEGVDIEGCPTGGAFDDGRFGYFMSDSELWRTDGKESRCIVDLAPYSGSLSSIVRSVRALSDGRLLVSMDGKLIELSESDGSDTIPVCDIGVLEYDAGLGNFSDFSMLVSKYNEQAEEFFIRVKEYRDAGKLNLAILSGDVDMVVTPNQTALKNYIKQDILVPLEEVSPVLFEKDVLIESVVNASKVDGVCYYLPVNFDILGDYIADPSLLKDEKTMEDRVAYYNYIKENDPEYFKSHTTYQILDNFISELDEWIDWEKNTCHFDDGTFAPLLELSALGCTDEAKIVEYKSSKGPLGTWWSRDEKAGTFTLTDGVESYRFTDLTEAQKYQKKLPASVERFAGPGTWVQVDFPMPSKVHEGYAIDAHNLYAIVDHEDTKEACGDFLRWLILEDVVEEFPERVTDDFHAKGWDGFSINKDETDRYLRRLIDGYVDPEDEVAKVNPNVAAEFPSEVAFARYWAQRYDARCGQTQYEITWEYINKADHLRYADSELLRVIHNEANGFFTGSITAEKAADYVQNRISLYLAEQS